MHNSASPDRMPSVVWNMHVWKSLCIRYEKFFILFTLKLCLQLRYYNFYGCSIRLLESGGWDTLHQWLNEYKELDEVPVLVLLLQTFQKLPVSMDLLKANTTAKIVKSLRKHSHEGLFLIDFINGVLYVLHVYTINVKTRYWNILVRLNSSSWNYKSIQDGTLTTVILNGSSSGLVVRTPCL